MNAKSMKAGTTELFKDAISLVAQRDPVFLSTVLSETSPASGDLEILDDDGNEIEIDFSQRAPGRLAIAVGQSNTGAVILPAWTLTAHLKYAGLVLETITQSIPETASGKWVTSALGFSQDNIQLADSVIITGTVDVPANCSSLQIRLLEKAPVIGADESMRAQAATGAVAFTDNPENGNTITLKDGVHTQTYEGDTGAQSSGSVTLGAGNASSGDTVNLHDKTFEINDGAPATGSIALEDSGGTPTNPAKGDTITLDDGTNTPTVLELDSGAFAAGGIQLTDQPADGDTIGINDGVHAASTLELDVGKKATGIITHAANANDGDTVIVTDGTLTKTFEADSGVKATGTVGLTDQPLDGQTITIQDGTHTETFEFDDDASVGAGNILVTIGATLSDTIDNLKTAIDGSTVTIATTKDGSALDLEADEAGSIYNVAITFTGDDIFTTGMTGGINPGDNVTAGNIGYAIGTTKEATAANFLAAFLTSGLNITAAASAPADEITNLTHNLYSTTGNQTIDVTGAGGRITTTDMTGGLNPGSDVGAGNVGVAIGATKEDTMANIIAAINGIVADLTITATPSTPADAECTLLSDVVGTAPNGGLSKSGANITITQLAGGLAAGDAVTPGNVGVAIGADADATMVNIIAAIVAAHATLTITPTAATPADHTCTLAADTKDTTHNVTILTTGANIQVTGMAGGLDNGDNISDPAYIGVPLGATNEDTIDNLITALKANLALDNTATVKSAGGAGAFIATIVWGVVGTVGNATVTVVCANLTKTNMTGGLNPGDAITPGNIGFAIGATKIISMANFVAAVEAQRLLGNITLSQQNNGDGTCDLQNDNPGTAGNVTLTKDGANITVTGMTGGLDAFTQRDMYNAMKDINVHIENADIDLEALGSILAKLPTLLGSGAVSTVCEPDMGAGVYSTTKGDITAAINNGAKTATIAWVADKCTPVPFTLAAKNVRRAQLVSATGVRTELSVAQCTVSSLTITFPDAPANFATGQLIDIWLQGAEKTPSDYVVVALPKITVPEGGVASTEVDFTGLLDARKYNSIEVFCAMVANDGVPFASTGDNIIGLRAKGVELAGQANGQLLQGSASSSIKSFGFRTFRSLATANAMAVYNGSVGYGTISSIGTPFAFRDLVLNYVLKGKGAGNGTYDALIYLVASK